MKFKETPLKPVIEVIDKHIVTLSRARHEFFKKKAYQKTFEARLIAGQAGKSNAEKTILAQATDEWAEFHLELNKLEDVFEFEKLKHEVLRLEYQAQYFELKSDSETIKRGGQ